MNYRHHKKPIRVYNENQQLIYGYGNLGYPSRLDTIPKWRAAYLAEITSPEIYSALRVYKNIHLN